MKKFNISISDSQATEVVPISPKNFDFNEYNEYASELNDRCKNFWTCDSGVLVYRRMRVADCFSFGCHDMKLSLENQLGALKKSMLYKADVPNFLEPWYGIGTIASAFGIDYIWNVGQAPAMKPPFKTLDEIFNFSYSNVADTKIGKHTLDMIDYFMDKTGGGLPISLTDTQSPLNIITHLISLEKFFESILIEPERVLKLFDVLANLSINFNKEQVKRLGSAIAYPGHGFASSQCWSGLGMSDDNALMISPEQYLELAVPSVEKICEPFGGPVFHSCGNWSTWLDAVKKINGILMVDGAFSPETDPDSITELEKYHELATTGIVLNARIVGDLHTIEQQIRRLWVPGMKLVVVTYCPTSEEQERAYNMIHDICTN
jgi:uroporphyrinogen-III decarboxylase